MGPAGTTENLRSWVSSPLQASRFSHKLKTVRRVAQLIPQVSALGPAFSLTNSRKIIFLN